MAMKWWMIPLGLALTLCEALAQAPDRFPDAMIGTVRTTFVADTAEGRLTSCSIQYNAFVRDWAYRQGRASSVVGNIGVMRGGKNLASTLKVIVNDVDMSGDDLKSTPKVPHAIYLRSVAGVSSALSFAAQEPSDTPGSLFAIFKIDERFFQIMDSMATTQRVDILFNRKAGSMDVAVPLDLTVASTNNTGQKTRSQETVSSFLQCVGKLAQ
jgi:hypothetical protein